MVVPKVGREIFSTWRCVQPGDADHIVTGVLGRLRPRPKERMWLVHGLPHGYSVPILQIIKLNKSDEKLREAYAKIQQFCIRFAQFLIFTFLRISNTVYWKLSNQAHLNREPLVSIHAIYYQRTTVKRHQLPVYSSVFDNVN